MTVDIERAVALLREGRLVAFPTETVYGLGADARSSLAARRIFEAKGRPGTNPLIVHVTDAMVARRYATVWPGEAETLAAKFWPGPLTLVLPKAPSIVDEVTAGRGTVGLRAPDHPLAQQLLRAFDGPVAAPSANRSTRVSPTTAEHVRQQLGSAVDYILDGGECRVGIESTVIDLTTPIPTLLRPGGVSLEQLREAIGEVRYAPAVTSQHVAATSPGQHAIHYSPHTPTFRFEDAASLANWLSGHQEKKVAVISLARLSVPGAGEHRMMTMPADPDRYAAKLYAVLHAADGIGASAICIEMPPETAQWLAVRDRLMRATRPAS